MPNFLKNLTNRLKNVLNIYIYIYIYICRMREVFSMNEIHVEPPFPGDYVRNGYGKHVITSTAKSKRVCFVLFFLFFKSQTAHKK